MPGAPKQFDQHAVLQKALEVFWAKGYEATSIHDLVAATGINRASMYHTFGNKEQLFLSSMQSYIEHAQALLDQTLSNSQSPLSNVEELLRHFVKNSQQNQHFGCFVNNVAIEMGPHNSEIAKMVRLFWRSLEKKIEACLERAVECGELNNTVDCKISASLINATLQGLVAFSKVQVPTNQRIQIIKQLIATIRHS